MADVDRRAVAGIDPGVSSYFDLMRVIAALTVVLSHLVPNLFGVDVIPGHDAVIVFFVISGYVIAFAAEQRDRTLERFVVNRLARLWSVLLPSLLVAAVAAAVAGPDSTLLYAAPISEPGAFLAAALQNALFLGQNWFWAAPAPFNDPVWSLSYEAWYYAIFAAFVFTPARWRWHAAALGVLLAGPPIAALMPCWLMGTWLYRRRDRLMLRPAFAYGLFAVCVALYGAVYISDLSALSRVWLSEHTANHSFRLRASTRFAVDFLDACLFGATIVAVRAMPAVNRGLAAAGMVARTISSKTFSLYLFHVPVFVILYGGLGVGSGSGEAAILCIGLVIGVCVLLGTVSEARLAPWRRVVQWGVDSVRGALSGAPFGGRRLAGWSRR